MRSGGIYKCGNIYLTKWVYYSTFLTCHGYHSLVSSPNIIPVFQFCKRSMTFKCEMKEKNYARTNWIHKRTCARALHNSPWIRVGGRYRVKYSIGKLSHATIWFWYVRTPPRGIYHFCTTHLFFYLLSSLNLCLRWNLYFTYISLLLLAL